MEIVDEIDEKKKKTDMVRWNERNGRMISNGGFELFGTVEMRRIGKNTRKLNAKNIYV